MFISFDGVDGAGKTTQLERFAQWLRQRGREVATCRDPGSTRLGEAVRRILLTETATPIHPRSEMLLYMAARAQLVEEVIRPALAEGKTVISDRFLLANIVYQGYAGGLGPEPVRRVGRVATDGVAPRLIFVLDLEAAAAAARRRGAPDRMESRGLDYLDRVRRGYLEEARRRPEECVVVDARGSADAVQARIQAAARRAGVA